jgi:hypothetical protein
MDEERSRHPQEPAEGSEGDTQAPGAERPGEDEESVGNMTDDPAGLEHPAKPAEGREEAEQARDAEQFGGEG